MGSEGVQSFNFAILWTDGGDGRNGKSDQYFTTTTKKKKKKKVPPLCSLSGSLGSF